ncbi:auxin-induced protein 15A-like [Sesamum indicum]|uniref:Auxin-induced protein 15A-like n=1 Tax=Sesamum indicum TaxID=4182 RepID=A0A6I9TUB9_SESIN|nr:auxin-induced protein 15A-like [Sesamum indicum]
MAIHMPRIIHAKRITQQSVNVPQGYLAVYIGDDKKRFVVPVSYLNHPSFQHLLNQAEEEFWFHQPTGGLTLPCTEDVFVDLASHLEQNLRLNL